MAVVVVAGSEVVVTAMVLVVAARLVDDFATVVVVAGWVVSVGSVVDETSDTRGLSAALAVLSAVESWVLAANPATSTRALIAAFCFKDRAVHQLLILPTGDPPGVG